MTALSQRAVARIIQTYWDEGEPDQFRDIAAEFSAVLRELIDDAAAPLIDSAARTLEGTDGVWEPLQDVGPKAIWDDLRPSEAVRLMQLVGEAQRTAVDQCQEIIVRALTDAACTFAAEHPNATRAEREAAPV